MKARPILFSAPMVQALLTGRKTQTRRIVKPQPASGCYYAMNGAGNAALHLIENGTPEKYCVPVKANSTSHILYCPFGEVGDLLWVRETFCLEDTCEYHEYAVAPKDRPFLTWKNYDNGEYFTIPHYRATEPEPHIVPYGLDEDDDKTRWKPSIFMPRWSSRITLEITNIRVERLQDISDKDAIEEGVDRTNTSIPTYASQRYMMLWNSINGKDSWGENPWVWVLEFKVHNCNVDDFNALTQPMEPA